MIETFNKNSRLLLLFVMLLFSYTITAQDDENGGGGFDWDGMNDLDNVNVPGYDGRSDDSWDQASHYWDTEPNNYPSNYEDYNDYEDYFNNDSNNNDSPQNNLPDQIPNGQNIIDKPVITRAELAKLIQDLIGRYEVSTNNKCKLTTSDGTTYTGIIIKFEDRSTGHSFYYFTPDFSSNLLKMDNYYKIPEPKSDGSTNTNSNISTTIPGSIDGYGMPSGFLIMETPQGDRPIFLGENNNYPEPYCQACTHINSVQDPKYPTLLRLLPKIKNILMNNPKIKLAFASASGYNFQEIDYILSYDNIKKLVRVADIYTFGLFEKEITPSFVFIREDLIASLETGGYKVGDYNKNLYDTSFFIAITILHELVHYSRFWNGLPTYHPRNGGAWEAGEVFESDIFGHVLTLNEVTKYAKQYGWNF